jgi:adenylate cyclase
MNGLLFIDDEEGIRRSVTRALKRSTYTLHTAENGRAGIAFVERNPQQIATVITDYKMPGIDGLETLSRIGEINPEITRIILTGYATMEVAIEATNQGVDGFLTKPFDNVEFRAKIHDICLRRRLRQFVPESVFQTMQRAPDALLPVFHTASVLFADIRNFTQLSVGVSPRQIAAFLNEHFFTPMGNIVFDYEGTVDKHLGDGMMVVFGAPVTRSDDPVRAVRTAMEMQRQAMEIDHRLQADNGFRLEIGIGITTGEVLSGVMGSLRKKEYTCIGMPVNIASRLQGLARGGEILISDKTWQCVQDHAVSADGEEPFKASALPPVRVKGLDRPLTVYRLYA